MFGRKQDTKISKAEPEAANIQPAPAAAAALHSTPAVAASGSAAPPVAEASDGISREVAEKRAQMTKRLEASLGQFVVLLMRAPQFKHHALSDLEWLVVPPLLHGQYVLAEAQSKTSGLTTPVGAVTWARVSPEVSAKLTASLTQPMRLRPDEWKSGQEIWVIDALGEPQVIASMLQKAIGNEWKGREVRMRVMGADGKPTVKILSEQQRVA